MNLVDSLQVNGRIINGICEASYQVTFFNNKDDLMEASFTFPFPPSCCPTSFSATFKGETKSSTIAHSDGSRLQYDDVLAASDLGVIVQIIEGGYVRADVGCLQKGEKCTVSVSFVYALAPFCNSLVLIFPAVPRLKQKTALTFSVNIEIEDTNIIKMISSPASVSLSDDKKHAVVSSKAISIAEPFKIALTYVKPLSRCLVDSYDSSSYLYMAARAPLAVRDCQTAFTLIVEQGALVRLGELSLILRAVELFMLSVPNNCSVNVIKFGDCLVKLFDSPMPVNAEIRNKAIDFVRQVQSSEKREIPLQEALKFLDTKVQSAVLVIGTNFEDETVLPDSSMFFFIDPMGRGDTRDFAVKKKASYIPVVDQDALFEALLQVIKMTATAPIADCSLSVDGESSFIEPQLPSVTMEQIVCVSTEDVKDVSLRFGDCEQPLQVERDRTKGIHFMWAFDDFKRGDGENLDALMPPEGGVVDFEREEELEGDVKFVEVEIESLKHPIHPRVLQQMTHQAANQQTEQQSPQREQSRLLQQNRLKWTGIQKPSQEVPLPHETSSVSYSRAPPGQHMKRQDAKISARNWENTTVYDQSRGQRPTVQQTRFYNGTFAKPQRQEKPSQSPTKVFRAVEVQQKEAEPKPMEYPKPAPKVSAPAKTKRVPFFLLKLLQAQSEDGSWRERKKMINCIGAVIPDAVEGLNEEQLLTCIAISALQVHAGDQKAKWEILAEKAALFLESTDSQKEWEAVVESLKVVFPLKK